MRAATLLRSITTLATLTLPWAASAQNLGNPSCDQLLLVSSWRTNNVKIYDGCSGQYVRDLDDANRLSGPQAMVTGADGAVYVISERNNRVVRYHRNSLTYDRVVVGDQPETPAVESSPLNAPTGAVFLDERHLYVVNFNGQDAVVVDVLGQDAPRQVFNGINQGLQGPDVGLAVDAQRRVYIPGFDSSTIIRADLDQTDPAQAVERISSSLDSPLDAPRTVLISPQQQLLVSSWRSSQILRFDASDGRYRGVFSTAVPGPTGMAWRNADELLVSSDQRDDVTRLNAQTGQVLGTLVTARSGGLQGATGLMVLRKQPAAVLQNVQQIWLGGLAQINGTTLGTEAMTLTRNGFFGTALRPEQIERDVWGSLEIRFDSCDSGMMSYQANPGFFNEFGTGGYPIYRLASSPAGRQCQQQGFDSVQGNAWMSGVWYGRESRDGEGFSIDVLDGDRAILTWYTYQPQVP